ncbi:eukaryotic translation initiation factor 3 subunit E [Pichia californica]|nr:eukaryotic translation initiation factor 3 subunit E [[Candida] californica]
MSQESLTESQIEIARKYDLSSKFFNFLDRHLIYPLLENLVTIYDVKEIDQMEYDILKDTYMIKLLKDIYLNLHPNEKDLPSEILNKENEIISKLVLLNDSTKKTLEILCSKEIQENLKQDKNLNKDLLKNNGIDDSKILELYEFGKLQYNRGDYVMASDLLNNFKLLSINQDLILNATCGKLVSDIMSNDWLEAKNELVKLREITDNRNYQGSTLEQLKLRNWSIHNSLFIFFNEKDLNEQFNNNEISNQLLQMNEIFISSSYLSAIEASCPWILRYIIASVLYTKDFRRLKDLIRAVEIETYEFEDPFTKLIDSLFIKFNLNELNLIFENIKILIETDYFINHLNSNQLIKNIIELILRNVLKIYKFLSIDNFKTNFINNINDDLIIEIINSNNDINITNDNIISLKTDKTDNYFQVYEKTKALSFKSTQFLNNAFGKDL